MGMASGTFEKSMISSYLSKVTDNVKQMTCEVVEVTDLPSPCQPVRILRSVFADYYQGGLFI